jgi:hypothetical protein
VKGFSRVAEANFTPVQIADVFTRNTKKFVSRFETGFQHVTLMIIHENIWCPRLRLSVSCVLLQVKKDWSYTSTGRQSLTVDGLVFLFLIQKKSTT